MHTVDQRRRQYAVRRPTAAADDRPRRRRQPRILLLDEATSALDNETQAGVSRSLENLKATRIVVAHRLSTVVHADRIYVIDGGRIVQSGRYEELVGQKGLFADLAKRQLA